MTWEMGHLVMVINFHRGELKIKKIHLLELVLVVSLSERDEW